MGILVIAATLALVGVETGSPFGGTASAAVDAGQAMTGLPKMECAYAGDCIRDQVCAVDCLQTAEQFRLQDCTVDCGCTPEDAATREQLRTQDCIQDETCTPDRLRTQDNLNQGK